MTILEAYYKYGAFEAEVSAGDSLTTIVSRIYGEFDDKYFLVLKTLNLRFDWHNLNPGDKIKYLSKDVINQIYEITS